MKKNKVMLVGVMILLGFLVFLGFPVMTNLFMITKPPFSWNVTDNNDWIGFFAGYYGAIIGGLLSGFFTYVGVKLTIDDQAKRRQEEFNINNRPQLDIKEIYHAGLDLSNVAKEDRKGRLILTKGYKIAERCDMKDGLFNFIVLHNLGLGTAVNCNVTIGVKIEKTSKVKIEHIFLPTINPNDRIFIPTDPIPDTREYRIDVLKIEFQSITGEEFRIERKYEGSKKKDVTSDIHYVKKEDGTYEELYKLQGANVEWRVF